MLCLPNSCQGGIDCCVELAEMATYFCLPNAECTPPNDSLTLGLLLLLAAVVLLSTGYTLYKICSKDLHKHSISAIVRDEIRMHAGQFDRETPIGTKETISIPTSKFSGSIK